MFGALLLPRLYLDTPLRLAQGVLHDCRRAAV
jgi:hypothetical protein